MRKIIALLLMVFITMPAHSVEIIATVNGNPITDADIKDRVKIMDPSLSNRDKAKNEIIDDYLKIEYARQFKIDPTEKEIDSAIKDHKDNPQMRLAARAGISWQIVMMRSIVPGIVVGDKEIADEMEDLERRQGLPLEITFIRLIDIPDASYKKLTTPKSCKDAEKMARSLGGEPQKITAVEYELAAEVREQLVGLKPLQWSPLDQRKTYLVCDKKKTDEWKNLDEVIQQNAVYKRAMFQADQLLKQLRRKAVISE